MLNFLRKSLALEIENFVSFLKLKKTENFTKSAFVQARRKIKPEVFEKLNEVLLKEFYTENDTAIKLWKGFRLLAVDGSRLTLPFTKELKAIYGISKNQSDTYIVQGRCSCLYDVLNNYVLDGTLAPLKIGERDLALGHLKHCQKNDLLIYDRGYPSYDFIHQHKNKNLNYLMRVKTSFSQLTLSFDKSKKQSLIVDLYPGKNIKISDKPYKRNTPIKVRLVRIELPKGEVEILITSLLDSKQYPTGIFKKLYYKRWGVETFYDELKNKLKLEEFSGYSHQSIQQDFNAALFVSNVQTLVVSELEEEIASPDQSKKYRYKVNSNLSYGFLKNRIVSLFMEGNSSSNQMVEELKNLFRTHLIPIRPNRSFDRNSGKYRSRIKPKITKNQKDTI